MCFSKSSDKFYNWLLNHPRFGKLVRDYMEKKGMPAKSKVLAITMMITAISLSAIFFTENNFIRLILFLIALGVSIYIISLNSIEKDTST